MRLIEIDSAALRNARDEGSSAIAGDIFEFGPSLYEDFYPTPQRWIRLLDEYERAEAGISQGFDLAGLAGDSLIFGDHEPSAHPDPWNPLFVGGIRCEMRAQVDEVLAERSKGISETIAEAIIQEEVHAA